MVFDWVTFCLSGPFILYINFHTIFCTLVFHVPRDIILPFSKPVFENICLHRVTCSSKPTIFEDPSIRKVLRMFLKKNPLASYFVRRKKKLYKLYIFASPRLQIYPDHFTVQFCDYNVGTSLLCALLLYCFRNMGVNVGLKLSWKCLGEVHKKTKMFFHSSATPVIIIISIM